MIEFKKNLGKIKIAITIFILIGIIIHLAMVYNAAKSIEIVDKKNCWVISKIS